MAGLFVYLPLFFLSIRCLAFSNVPLFLWSGEKYFGVANRPHPEANGLMQIDHFIHDFKSTFGVKNEKMNLPKESQDSFLNYVSKEKDIMPEVVIAFVYSKLDSVDAARQVGAYSSEQDDSMSLSFLKKLMDKSKSSLIVPHLLMDSSSASASVQLTEMFSTTVPKPEIVELQLNGEENGLESEADQNIAGCKALMGHLDQNKWLFSNLATDLIMIKADNFKDMEDECVMTLLERVDKLTSGHYVAVLTADTAKTDIVQFFPTLPELNINSFMARPDQTAGAGFSLSAAGGGQQYLLVAQTDTTWPGVRYITTNMLFGVLIGLMFLFTVMCAVNCLASIETPQRLSAQRYNIGKQD